MSRGLNDVVVYSPIPSLHAAMIVPDIDTYAEADSVERIVDDVLTRLLDEWIEWWDIKLRAFLVQLEECAKGEG